MKQNLTLILMNEAVREGWREWMEKVRRVLPQTDAERPVTWIAAERLARENGRMVRLVELLREHCPVLSCRVKEEAGLLILVAYHRHGSSSDFLLETAEAYFREKDCRGFLFLCRMQASINAYDEYPHLNVLCNRLAGLLFRFRRERASEYRKAMERAERMMERYLPFYQYYHSGATYRDSYYFLRAKGELSPESGSFVLDEEAEFSTGYDILAARLISVEMLLVHLSRRMERAAQGTETEAVPEKEHRWTNTKVAAILLVYGIHVTGSVDEGNAEIGELAALFEKHFHVDLGNVYHAFGRLRGQQNPTAFLDEMKERLLKKMRDMDSR